MLIVLNVMLVFINFVVNSYSLITLIPRKLGKTDFNKLIVNINYLQFLFHKY